MKDIYNYGFHFEPKEYKEGVLNGKIEGDLQFVLKMKNPDVEYETVLQYGVKVRVKQKLFGENEIGDLPEKIITFERKFAECFDEFGPDEEIDLQMAVVEAVSLFMIDNMADVDMDQLNRTRESLLATFQDNPKQVEKIDTSYNVLKEILMQQQETEI